MYRSDAPYSVRGLHYTWLVSSTRASSDGVDDSDSGEWIHLKRGVDRKGCDPIGLREHCIMLCGGVRQPSGESREARHRGWSQGRPGRLTQDGQGYNKPLNLVPRGTQISYSTAVDLVAELGVSQ
ncbi:hypothetical protein M9H77_31700 [Catharanthus roseus]|uniref:Uncharacterized protein n=1 Tax=Catharanthus roseus TaxID=4058 RepID=A0ACC0A354_CATRO|nr:hypothetical protein M9H77_31700 [Catharanthus roseus]